MAFMAVLESDLRALSTEARRRYPAIKDGAEHAILKLRSLSTPSEIAQNEDILGIFLMACEVKIVRLSVISLSCLQKLIVHDAVSRSAMKEILATLKDHSEMADDNVQLKTLQTILIIFQSRLHPKNEDDMAHSLGIILRLLENSRSPDSVRNTAAATFRQASALIFDHVLHAESLPAGKTGLGSHVSRTYPISSDDSHGINNSVNLVPGTQSVLRNSLTEEGRLGLRLLEDLTAFAAGGSGSWLRVNSVQRAFALDILEFVLSNYVAIFRYLIPYEQILRHQICSLLMTSLRTNAELEGEAGEPYFRRLVLRSVSHVVRLYSSSLVTECEVFLNMLVKSTSMDLSLWHQILVLEILRGFCVEARTLRLLFQNFDMNPKNTNVVEGMVMALARVVSTIQVPETSEESLAAVAGMFSSKAKGIEWSLDNDASNAAVVVASEAHAITLAIEGLLGVVFTVATLTDEAVDMGELESPRCDTDPPIKWTGQTASISMAMVDSLWLVILDALSLILARSQGEAIILEILKGYQAFTQACGVLRMIEPLNSFLASLCKFTISFPDDLEKKSLSLSPGSKRLEYVSDQRDYIVLTTKNVQALRTLFNIAHRLHNVLGPSWVLVLETLAALDRAIHSPHATTQEVSAMVPRLTRDASGQYTDFNILSSLNSQLFESSAMMHISAVKALLSALGKLSNQCSGRQAAVFNQLSGGNPFVGSTQQIANITFSVERMRAILKSNLHRVEPLWDLVAGHLVELAENSNSQVRNIALEALDQSICTVLSSDQFHELIGSTRSLETVQIGAAALESRSFECAVISPLKVLYTSTQIHDVRVGAAKILLHVLERHGEKLFHSWQGILEMLRLIVDSSDKELIPLGFQTIRVIMNDGLSTIPPHCLHVCIEVTGAYGAQKAEVNISLTAIGLLWTATDFIAKVLWSTMEEEITHLQLDNKEAGDTVDRQSQPKQLEYYQVKDESPISKSPYLHGQAPLIVDKESCDKLLFLVFSILQKLGADERPEVRNSAIRTLFQTLSSHGQKLSRSMWKACLWDYVFPILDNVASLAASSSRDEWRGKELGIRGGKAIHMLIHHSRNTAQKQWDETLVLVLGGIARILRSFFPFFLTLDNFWSGWESLLLFVRNSISNGSKEVALAAINCLQTTVLSHGSKGDLPISYAKSILDVYELILQHSSSFKSSVAFKVEQEILHSLGDFYNKAKLLFDNVMYSRLLGIVHLAVRYSKITSDDAETDSGNITPVQRIMLEMLPMLQPAPHLCTMWSLLLRQLFCYLPGFEAFSQEVDDILQNRTAIHTSVDAKDYSKHTASSEAEIVCDPAQVTDRKSLFSDPEDQQFVLSTNSCTTISISNQFAEKLVPVIVRLYLHAPKAEKGNILPELVQALGRCMTTRRDYSDGALWRQAVEGFIHVLMDDTYAWKDAEKVDQDISRPMRIRFWREVADVCEKFLVGSCGRALPSSVSSPTTLIADEALEMAVLDVLSDRMLQSNIDAPAEVLQRLVSTLDCCASRTASLPVESIGLLPLHCSRFSLACLQKIFSLCSYEQGGEWHTSRLEMSKVAVHAIIRRCEFILERYLVDENELGELPLPSVRLEETIFVLKELVRLVLHPATASLLFLSSVKATLPDHDLADRRTHLLVLFPSFCELVVSREARVRELVQVLLRLVGSELGLQKRNSGA